jgi:EAL and modified HD-GYP domain-containing signal transduction protein
MDATEPVPLMTQHLLADRNGKLAGLRLDLGEGAVDAITALVERPDFLRLTVNFPCVFLDEQRAHWPPALINALTVARCKPVPAVSIFRADRQLEHDYAPHVEWLDGDWYLAPLAKPTANQAASRAIALQLVQLVAADADSREIEAVFRHDPTLSYHLLRLVNSLGVGAGRRITSFSQAIVILGRLQLRRWLNLMLFAARGGDQRSAMLLALVAMRARTMELLARSVGLDKSLQEQAFMVGMFSLLGILFGMPIEEVLRPLAIGEATRAAVLSHSGELGQLLQLTEAAECCDFGALGAALGALQVSHEEFNLISVQACDWMVGVVRESQVPAHG